MLTACKSITESDVYHPKGHHVTLPVQLTPADCKQTHWHVLLQYLDPNLSMQLSIYSSFWIAGKVFSVVCVGLIQADFSLSKRRFCSHTMILFFHCFINLSVGEFLYVCWFFFKASCFKWLWHSTSLCKYGIDTQFCRATGEKSHRED